MDNQNEWPILNKKNLAHLNRSVANLEPSFEQGSGIKLKRSDKKARKKECAIRKKVSYESKSHEASH